MRYVPSQKSKRAIMYREAVYDFFGEMNASANKVAVYLQKPTRGIDLTEEEKKAAWCVKKNIESGCYR